MQKTLNPPALCDSQNHMNLDFLNPSGQNVIVFRVLAWLPVVTEVVILLCGVVRSAVAAFTAALAGWVTQTPYQESESAVASDC